MDRQGGHKRNVKLGTSSRQSAFPGIESGDLAYGFGDGAEVLTQDRSVTAGDLPVDLMFGLRAATFGRTARIRSRSSALLPKDEPEATTYRVGTVMLSSTGPNTLARAIMPASMLLFAICSALIRGRQVTRARPGGDGA